MRKGITAGTYEGEEVPKMTKWVYSVSGMFRDACYALVASFLLNYIMYSGLLGPSTEDYNAQMTVINALFVVFLIWDGINDPIFGLILEKVHLKTGKFRPWILIGGILNTIVVALLFTVRPTGWAFVVFWGIFYFLWDAVFTLNDIGYWAMLPSMTSSEKIRSKITTLMGIFVSIGQFAMYGICSLLPEAQNYSYIYAWIAIPTVILFLLSQLAIFFLCKEKKRDPKQEKVSEETHLKDLFTVLGKNKPLRASVISLFFYSVGSSLMIGMGTTYFYLLYGYGGSLGGTVTLIFTVCYAVGSLGAQALYGLLSRKAKKQTLFTVSSIIALVAYASFFLVSVPLFGNRPIADNPDTSATSFAFAFGGTMWLNYIPPLIFFAAEQVFYLTMLVAMQNTIEYNEWKNKERRESVIFSWRPLVVKVSSAAQKLVIWLTLMTSGLYASVTSKISELEQKLAGNISADPSHAKEYEELTNVQVQNLIKNINRDQLVQMGLWMIGSMIVCMAVAWLVMKFGYKLDEKEYANILAELEETRAKDIAEAEAASEEVVA